MYDIRMYVSYERQMKLLCNQLDLESELYKVMYLLSLWGKKIKFVSGEGNIMAVGKNMT